MEIQAKSIPPDSSFKKEQLIILVVAGCSRRGPLNNLPAFEQPASRRPRAAFEGGGWIEERVGEPDQALGALEARLGRFKGAARRALRLSRALHSHLVLSHNWLRQPSLAAGDLQKRGVPLPQLPHGFAVFL